MEILRPKHDDQYSTGSCCEKPKHICVAWRGNRGFKKNPVPTRTTSARNSIFSKFFPNLCFFCVSSVAKCCHAHHWRQRGPADSESPQRTRRPPDAGFGQTGDFQ